MYSIDQINFDGKKALVRVDFNVPLNAALEVTDNSRIKAAVRTIRKITADGGIAILMSHLGRPKGGPEDKYSLRHVVPALEALLGHEVHFVANCVGEEAVAETAALPEGSVALLENLRFYKEEEAGDEFFAGQLAEHGDVYINDAFGTAHREHASTAVIARFFPRAKYFGYLMEDEVRNIEKVLHHPEHPVCAIIGGAKVSSKIAVLKNLLDKVDHLIIGGGMAFTFIKANGGNTGNSLVEEGEYTTALGIMEAAKQRGVEIHLPVDAMIADEFSNLANRRKSKSGEIPDGWMGLDVGPEAVKTFKDAILASKTILWNGPMGVFEFENFREGTLGVAKAMAEATKQGSFSLVGGGDSVAAINLFNMASEVSYVSTGGGAMLEFLEGLELPGIKAIRS